MSQTDPVTRALRRILNETRQDRVCRSLLEKRDSPILFPFLGSRQPTYFFLGACPVGYDEEGVPEKADEYLEFATGYFERDDTDKGPFVHYLPFTANHHEDYAVFGQVSALANLVPIPARRTSELQSPMLDQCWPRCQQLVEAVGPKLVLCHGATTWKYLAGLEENREAIFSQLPDSHRKPLKEVYAQLEGAALPFKSAWKGSEREYWFLPLPHLGKSAPGKFEREKGPGCPRPGSSPLV